VIKQKIYLLLVLGTFDIYSFEFSFLENYKKLISFSCATLLTLPILYKIYKIKQEIKKEEIIKKEIKEIIGFDGVEIFNNSLIEIFESFSMSGQCYGMLNIEKVLIPKILKEYEEKIKEEEYLKNPEYKSALKDSYLIFKSSIFNYKKYLKTKNEEIAKLIKCRKLLPEELEPSIGLELDHLINKNDLSSQILTKLAKIESRLI